MGFITLIFVAVGLSMDAFAVSVTSGCLLPEVRVRSALRTAFFFGGFQAAMPVAGYFSASAFKSYIEAFDHWVAFGLLAGIGLKMIYEAIRGDDSTPKSDPFSNKNLLIMAVATSIDALAVGAGFALFEVNIFAAAAIIGLTTFSLSYTGVIIGCRTGTLLKDKAELLGGFILIAIGVKILLEHTVFS